ncbi:MAG TPA: inositol monophosphatase family protein [Candidatus Krumholzibacteria bacterium]|nr:inositol monophosphatase family protein [Candidatus Krumholzibacteria bacterium]
MTPFQQELDVARGLALQAGRIIRASYAKLTDSDVDEKGRNDFVTVVDHESQRLVVEGLRAAFPDDFIVAEEVLAPSVNAGRESSRRRWYIDPLDGTTNYIHAYPHFAVTMALEVDGDLSVAVTYAPLLEEMFTAIRGAGTHLNGQPVRVSRLKDENKILLGTGFPFRARHLLDVYLRSFAYFFHRARGIRRGGSAAMDLAYVAAGRLDAFWEITLSPWDIAAGILLIEEAGGRVTDFFGERTFMQTGHVIASNGLLHEVMLDGIAGIFPRDGDYSKRS